MTTATPKAVMNARSGARLGMALATVFSAAATLLRIALGSAPFQRLGASWTEVVVIYYAGLTIGGYAYGALTPLRRHALGAALAGFLFVFPVYAALSVLLGLALKRIPSLQVGLIIGAVLSLFVGGTLGISLWIDEQERTAPPVTGGAATPAKSTGAYSNDDSV